MKKFSWSKNSIFSNLILFVIVLIFAQSLLIIGSLIAGGVLREVQENAFVTFHEKVNNRKDYIQREMGNRWTNIDPYVKQISTLLNEPSLAIHEDAFWEQSASILIPMLRTTMATGAFIILADTDSNNIHPALYFRDYDPSLNDNINNDLYLIAGPYEISKSYRIPMDQVWSYQLVLDSDNRAFYDQPFKNAALSTDPRLVGYWSKPFQLSIDDWPIITYTMPLFDDRKQLKGIIGVEISINYFNEFLPAAELISQDSLGYLIGYSDPTSPSIMPLITKGALQKRMLHTADSFDLQVQDASKNIFLLENHNSHDQIYASVEKMGLYNFNTPFEEEQWYLIGLMEENKLLRFVNKITDILLYSFLGSLLLGTLGGYFVSYRFSKPIIDLAEHVRKLDASNFISLKKTGLAEVDALATAMEVANANVLETTLKMSKIIDLVDVSIGAFEYNSQSTHVFATEQLQEILGLDYDEFCCMCFDKPLFVKRLEELLLDPELEEENIYRIHSPQTKWVKIKMIVNDTTTLGVAIDVTDEMLEKLEIKKNLDFDPLTGIYSRAAFERLVTLLLNKEPIDVAALLMFDLDHLKYINDTYGHQWGDTYIKNTATMLSKFSKSKSVVGRRSGDEFFVFLYGYESKEQIRDAVNVFYESLKQHPIHLPDASVREIMISGGLVWIDSATFNYDAVLHSADQALYHAKQFNKGTLQEYKS